MLIDPWRISIVTYIQVAQGCRDKVELAQTKKGLAYTEIIPASQGNSMIAMVGSSLCLVH